MCLLARFILAIHLPLPRLFIIVVLESADDGLQGQAL